MSGENVSIVIDKEKTGGIRAAFLEDGFVRSFYFLDSSSEPRTGDILFGKVKNSRVRGMGWFLDLGGGMSGFLPRGKLISKTDPEKDEYRIVQVEKEATADKPAGLTEQIQLAGEGMIYLPSGNYIAVSRRIAAERRRYLEKLAASWRCPPEGVIMRTRAQRTDPERLAEEFIGLRNEWQAIAGSVRQMKRPDLVRRRFSLAASIINENHGPFSCTIYSNVPLDSNGLPSSAKIIYETEDNLFAGHCLEVAYRDAQRRCVPLGSGASLIIDYTAALTAVDVNSGSRSVKTNWETVALSTNLEAAEEIARQIRLRGIGGMIVIDFLRMNRSEDRVRILDRLKRAVARDPATIKILGYSRMGLVELTRKRKHKGLRERQMFDKNRSSHH